MQKIRILLILATIFSAQVVFAAGDEDNSSKPCGAIADACLKAGYGRDQSDGKKFWADCMKPVLLKKSVDNVTIDPATVKACRTDKISELKSELKEFQSAK